MEGGGDTFRTDVESDVVGVAVETEAVATDSVTKGENFCDEAEGICSKVPAGTARELGAGGGGAGVDR